MGLLYEMLNIPSLGSAIPPFSGSHDFGPLVKPKYVQDISTCQASPNDEIGWIVPAIGKVDSHGKPETNVSKDDVNQSDMPPVYAWSLLSKSLKGKKREQAPTEADAGKKAAGFQQTIRQRRRENSCREKIPDMTPIACVVLRPMQDGEGS